MRCPECQSGDLRINMQVNTDIFLERPGFGKRRIVRVEHHELYWDKDDYCACIACGYESNVGEFYERRAVITPVRTDYY